MRRIEQAGKLDDWSRDNLDWLKKTYGAENIVSAVVHLDETTTHIHATMIPIVTGERRKAKAKQVAGKKKYRKKSTDTDRLCADDVMSRVRLKEYQNPYAEQMAKYGLQRGIDGSEAKHVTTSLNKIFNYFPHIKELLRWENFLRSIGLPDDMVCRLFNKETVVGSGELYSKEHSKRFKVKNASLKLEQDKAKPENIRFTINRTDIFDWFKQKQKEFLN